MSLPPDVAIPPRWGPLTPQRWPQDENRVPNTLGAKGPPISTTNRLRSRRESFAMPGAFSVPFGNAAGQVFPLYLPTDQDGDFWCDQIQMNAWFTSIAINARPPPCLIQITDARTGRSMTYPQNIPVNFLYTGGFFSEDAGFDPGSYPFPDGFRSTGTLPQPFCFTRAGGIQLYLTMLPPTVGPDNLTIDIVFSGWKEYEAASDA